jgi:polyisoprenoid-binding protein YceI
MILTLRVAAVLLTSMLAWTACAAADDVVPAGAYRIEPSHASLLFKVDHLGFSKYTARFKRFDARLQFDPARLAASRLNVTVDATSLETDFPDPAKLDFNKELQGADWLNAAAHPQMTYRSRSVVPTGDRTFRIDGELTLRGVTRPVSLDARYNGGYAGHPMDPNARIGFSATGRLKRSDFGMTIGVPPPGSTMGVGDEVQVIVEAEFTGPPLKQPASR